MYKCVPANLMLGGQPRSKGLSSHRDPGNEVAGGNPAMDQHPIQGGVEILLVASCYGNRDKLRPGGPHWPVCRLN